MSFSYICGKIKEADFQVHPFKHVYLENLFSAEHFQEITASSEINLHDLTSDNELFEKLFENGYKIIEFPGTVTNKNEYLQWHKSKQKDTRINTSCEGFGIVLRLEKTKSNIIQELEEFLNCDEFKNCIAEKYQVSLDECTYDAGIQKYLDGYEISPHPDVRRKALTYMVNINPYAESEAMKIHTHYLTFNSAHEYIPVFWQGNEKIDRCWVPWKWCETKKVQQQNNSMVIFQPDYDTLHAVKAEYDHLKFQRTQLYGNYWYSPFENPQGCHWTDLVIEPQQKESVSLASKAKEVLPESVYNTLRDIKNVVKKKSKDVGDRNY